MSEPPAAVVRSQPAFVGRRAQLQWLQTRLTEARAGHPQLVFLSAEAGVGKTRLVKELGAAARTLGEPVVYSRCYEDLTVPYLPLIEALQGQAAAGTAAVRRLLARVTTPSRSARSSSPQQSDEDKLRLFLAVSRNAIRLAQRASALLVLDDLHWADRATLELLAHVAFAAADAAQHQPVRLMIIGTYRPVRAGEYLAGVVARLQREEICRQLDLPPLDELEVSELIRHLGVSNPAHQLVTTINEATRGNPLFIEEVVHDLIKRGALQERGGHLVTTVAATDLHLPEEVTAAIAAKIAGLPEECRRVLTLAAFLGERLSLPVLRAVSGIDDAALMELLEEAERQRVAVSDGSSLQFAHPLVRHVLYSGTNPLRRRHIHGAIARTLESLYGSTAAAHIPEIAHHWIAAGPAGDPEKVLHFARRAGDQAVTVFAWDEAARCYEAALAMIDAGAAATTDERADLHRHAGLAHYRNMDVGLAVDQYERAILAYRAASNLRGLAQVLVERTRAHVTLASVPYGAMVDVQELEAVLHALGEDEPAWRGQICAILAQVYWTAQKPEQAAAIARQALAIGNQIGDHHLSAEASHALALAQIQSLEVREALDSWQRCRAHARAAKDLWLQGWPLPRLPLTLTLLGRFDEAEALAREAHATSAKTHDWAAHSVASAALVSLAAARGDFEAAERHAHEALRMLRRSHYPWSGVIVLPALACARCLRGRWAEAEDALATLVEPGQVFEEVGAPTQLMVWVYRQLLRAHSGARDDVRAQLGLPRPAPQRERPDTLALFAYAALVEIGDLVGDPGGTPLAYEVLSQATERGVLFSAGWGAWVFLIARILGVAATLNHWWDKAEGHFQSAIDVATDCGARPELARSYLDWARMLVARDAPGDATRAIEALQQAVSIGAELDMQPCLQRALALADQLHAPIAPPRLATQVHADGLTDQEVEVLRHVARGRSDQDIAAQCALSAETVARQVDSILRKTGAADRDAAIAYAAAQGLVPRARPSLGDTGEPRVILFTDMEGSTALIQRLGDTAARTVARTHNSIIRACLRAAQGVELHHTGDGVMASFPSATAAVECAVAIQKNLARHNLEHADNPIRVRIGINAGEPLADEDRLFGAAVNAAARICARADPGQILVSEVIRQLAAGKTLHFADRGRARLKGFTERFRLYEVQW